MSGSGLLPQLLRMGRAAALTAEAGRIRFWALVLATALTSLAVAGLVLAAHSFDARAERSVARSPRLIDAHPRETPRALWAPVVQSMGDKPYDVVYIEPTRADAPLPPGLPRWPEPGEAFLSPALLEAGRKDGIATQYGRFGGVISPAGLEAPAERFAYVRPGTELLDTTQMLRISGFGENASAGFVGESTHNFGPQKFFAGYVVLVLLPALLLVVIAARAGAASRDRRTALLSALGAGTTARAAFTVGEAALPIGVGAAVAAVCAAVPLVTDTSYPVVDFVLSARDARGAWPALVGWLLAVPAAVMVLTVVLQPGRRRSGASTRPTALAKRRSWLPWIFPFALLLTVRVTELVPVSLLIPVYAVGCVLVFATLPAVIGTAVSALGPILARLGRTTGSPGLLVAGRRLGSGARSVTRLVAAMVIAIGLAAQAQMWTTVFGTLIQGEVETHKRVGTSVVRVAPYADGPHVRTFERALPADALAVAVRVVRSDIDVTGSCAALAELDVPCRKTPVSVSRTAGDVRWREIIGRTGAGDGAKLSVRRGDVSRIDGKGERGDNTVLLLLGRDHRQLPVPELSTTANRTLAMKASVRPLADLSGTGELVTAAGWVRLMALLGVGIVALVAGLSAMSEFLGHGREIAPLSVLTGNRGVFYAMAGWSLLLPAVLAALTGVTVSWWMAAPLNSAAQATPMAMAPITVGALACAVGLAGWGARAAAKAADGWRPSAE
ncbi:hypothetical protein [Streptomyces sp. NPDC052225]|uniref:hypothetical protein n=1 Tax=Streptomyces sp. NPDC052225 TaxID=3154949 RepID=UPI003414D507